MSELYRTIKLKELAPIIEDYKAELPGWQLFRRDELIRGEEPFIQSLWFDRLSIGYYRIVSGIYVLCAWDSEGKASDFIQTLNYKVESISRFSHKR